jgi:uncharacterized protein
LANKDAWTAKPDGIRLRIRLTPKSSRDAVEGFAETAEGQAFAARVRAVPEDGKANAAAEALIADWLDVSRSAVRLVSGQKSRVKLLDVQGDPGDLANKIKMRLDSGGVSGVKGRKS